MVALRGIDSSLKIDPTTDVSILIKTTDRPHCLHKLIHAIQHNLPHISLLVADDGKIDARSYVGETEFENHELSYLCFVMLLRVCYAFGGYQLKINLTFMYIS